MSLRRTCDCPETYCHAAEDYYLGKAESYFLDEGSYQTIGNFDVCLVCLDGCMHWQPYALEDKFVPPVSQITKMVMDVYDSKIRESLAVQNHFYKRVAESSRPSQVGDTVTFKLMLGSDTKDQNEEK